MKFMFMKTNNMITLKFFVKNSKIIFRHKEFQKKIFKNFWN